MPDRPVLVIGVGNELQGDDGIGIEISRRLRDVAARAGIAVLEHQGEPTALLEAWRDARAVVLVDTMRSGAPTGTIRRFDASREPLPAKLSGSSSTHAIALGEAIELGRALQRLPERLIVFAIEGRNFEAGAPICDELAKAAPALTGEVMAQAIELAKA